MAYTLQQLNQAEKAAQDKLKSGAMSQADYSKAIVKINLERNKLNNTQSSTPKITTNNNTNNNIITGTNTGTFGTTASNNVLTNKMEDTGTAFENRQSQTAADIKKVNQAAAAKEQELLKQKNEAARQRYDNQQKELDNIKTRSEGRVEQRRSDSDDLLRRQEGIAARQSNMAAGQAGESGLQMSQGVLNELKNDIISTYGANLATAEQFRLQTNINLDDALTKLDSDIFKDKQSIDNFINQLDDQEIQPLLNAVAAGLKGDMEAIEKVKEYYNTLIQAKTDETFGRFMSYERMADNQNQWAGADNTMRGTILSNSLGAENKYLMDRYWSNPKAFEKMSYEEALTTMMKLGQDENRIVANQQLIATYAQLKATAQSEGKPFNEIPMIEKMLVEGKHSLDSTHKTQQEKRDAMGDQTGYQAPQTGSINTVAKLSSKVQGTIDDFLTQGRKQELITNIEKLLQSGKVNQRQYDSMIAYMNSK